MRHAKVSSREKAHRGRRGPALVALASIAAMLMVLLVAGAAMAQPLTFTRVDPGAGFNNPDNDEIACMAVFNNLLYAGTNGTGDAEVWAYNGNSWTQSNEDGFGDGNNDGALSMKPHAGRLFAGTVNTATGAEVWAYNAVTGDWSQVNTDGFGDADNTAVETLEVFNGSIYAGVRNATDGGRVYVWTTGTNWDLASADGLGDTNNVAVTKLQVYANNLYAGTENTVTGAEASVFAAPTTWNQVNDDGFGSAANVRIAEMEVYRDNLYAGTQNATTGGHVWSYNGTDWTPQTQNGFGDTNNDTVSSMTLFMGNLTAGTRNTDSGGELWWYDGTDWAIAGPNGLGDPDNLEILSQQVYMRRLFAGTLSGAGGQVLAAEQKEVGATSWFLPEGSTGDGFDTWVLIQNPNAAEAEARVTFLTPQGPQPPVDITLEADSRTTVRVADYVPNEFSISTTVTSDLPVVTERSMYWNKMEMGDSETPGNPQPYEMKGGHANLGIPSADIAGEVGRTTYFAEGATAGGFDTWILLSNPGATNASAHLTFMTETGIAEEIDVAVPAGTRQTVKMDDHVPNSFGVATTVSSAGVIVAERATYWDPRGPDVPAWDALGGSSTNGAVVLSNEWFLPEGSTGIGFDTWVMVANPGDQQANVEFTFSNEDGVVGTTTLNLQPETRGTVQVDDFATNLWEVATTVTSDQPVVAERTMYWDKRQAENAWSMRAGHATVGSAMDSNGWLVPEGSTGGGFDSWVLVSNPADDPVTVHVRFMNPSGVVRETDLDIVARGRLTIHVNEYVPNDFEVSTEVTCDDGPVILERAMYWDSREASGIQPYEMMGGHAASGLDP